MSSQGHKSGRALLAIGSWAQVNLSGFGTPLNDFVGDFAVFNNYLYIGTRNLTTGAQLWRSSDGTTWNSVTTNGFGDGNNEKLESLFVFDGALYAGLNNVVTGLEVWRSYDGSTWNQINEDGFGDSYNEGTLWSNETVIFNNHLYWASRTTLMVLKSGSMWGIQCICL